LEGRLGKWLAMLVAAFGVLRRATPMPVELNGERRRIWLIFIGNCEYQPPGLAPRSRARLDDGRFDIRYLDGTETRSRFRVLVSLASGRLARSRVYKRMVVESLHIRSLDGPLRLARDGETFDGGDDVHVTKHPDRLSVYAPPS
jgi:diacylglycerol kinase family enzyme